MTIEERIAATEQRMAERAAEIANAEQGAAQFIEQHRRAQAERGAAQLEDKGALALLYELREMSGEG